MTPEAAADRIAAAVTALPQVAGLHGGRFGEIATLAPGRRVPGVRVRDEEVTVAVIARFPLAAGDLAEAVRVAAGIRDRPVHVVVADLALPDLPDDIAEEEKD
ncbi:hypothetical protein [Amycolatopsis jiangsuensis]|uniref:Asp23/Gls24 family envelope stress response protein n=1 Tax=Amycolatopsis jiangsuensis TaxID=1181879 RepID=A0A840ISP8_9PSEU|nr:hypothetical protein [Amycolatopsis jiangsuensis]MBB4684168.1 hypothetical protein [Amycolatopsis jiangsuensis]